MYIGSTNTNCLQSEPSAGSSCQSNGVYTTAFDYFGYPDYVQYPTGTSSKGNGASGMDASTTIAVAVVVPIVVVALLVAGAVYWYSRKQAPLLKATEMSNAA